MGNCIKSTSLPDNEFEVYRITSSGKLRGVLQITDTKFLFAPKSDRDVEAEWHFEHIRKCVCNINLDGNIFIIDAGSKCPIGEDRYHFSTAHAQELYDLFSEIVTRKSQQSQALENVAVDSSPRYENQEILNNPIASDEGQTQPPDKVVTLNPDVCIGDNGQSINQRELPKASGAYSSIDVSRDSKVMPENLKAREAAQGNGGQMNSPHYVNLPGSAHQCMDENADKQENKSKLKIDENEHKTLDHGDPPYVNLPKSHYASVEIDHIQEEATGTSRPKATYNYSTVDEAATLALTKVKQERDKEKKQKPSAKQDNN